MRTLLRSLLLCGLVTCTSLGATQIELRPNAENPQEIWWIPQIAKPADAVRLGKVQTLKAGTLLFHWGNKSFEGKISQDEIEEMRDLFPST